jgi:hypothetical protein
VSRFIFLQIHEVKNAVGGHTASYWKEKDLTMVWCPSALQNGYVHSILR